MKIKMETKNNKLEWKIIVFIILKYLLFTIVVFTLLVVLMFAISLTMSDPMGWLGFGLIMMPLVGGLSFVVFPFMIGRSVASKVKTKKIIIGSLSSLIYSFVITSSFFLIQEEWLPDDTGGFIALTMMGFVSGIVGTLIEKIK